MMLNKSSLSSAAATLVSIAFIFLTGCTLVDPPDPYGALPSERQLAWHELSYYAFIHFSPNTFTDKEWGYGDESPEIFNPSELDCMQWARVASEAGMEGIVITAKHHDGFCLWPSAYTEHSVKHSPWKGGKGDVLADLREACDAYGLKLGIYLSPWDRNHSDYGTPEYIEYYRNQLKELLTAYGEIFEVWFDGANGGDGYYGGARETRTIDNRTYYDWKNTWVIVRELQPMAVMFSDAGPDIRWIGNEQGYASDPNWSTMNSHGLYPGVVGKTGVLGTGHEDGDRWLPAEVNTSLRPGWFYHESQDSLVKSLDKLVDIWFHSVGMNGNLILNLPPDRRGLIHEEDVKRLMEFKAFRDKSFSIDYTESAHATASLVRDRAMQFAPEKAIDNDPETYWTTDDNVHEAYLEIEFEEITSINALMIQEYIPLGQRISGFRVDAWVKRKFVEVARGVTIGNRRLVRFETLKTDRIRLTFTSKACPVISNVEVYYVPDINVPDPK
jgi:alpha-L-fucosidase